MGDLPTLSVCAPEGRIIRACSERKSITKYLTSFMLLIFVYLAFCRLFFLILE